MHALRCYRSDLNQFQRFLSDKYDARVGASRGWVRAWVVHMMQGAAAPNHPRKVVRSHIQPYARHVLHGPRPQQWCFPAEAKSASVSRAWAPTWSLFWTNTSSRAVGRYKDRLMMTLLYETGMHRDELIKLKHADVQVSRRTIKVSGKGGKERLIPVSEPCWISRGVHAEPSGVSEFLIVTDSGRELYPAFVSRVNHYYGDEPLAKCSRTSSAFVRHAPLEPWGGHQRSEGIARAQQLNTANYHGAPEGRAQRSPLGSRGIF